VGGGGGGDGGGGGGGVSDLVKQFGSVAERPLYMDEGTLKTPIP
jgi:hypothetical protein